MPRRPSAVVFAFTLLGSLWLAAAPSPALAASGSVALVSRTGNVTAYAGVGGSTVSTQVPQTGSSFRIKATDRFSGTEGAANALSTFSGDFLTVGSSLRSMSFSYAGKADATYSGEPAIPQVPFAQAEGAASFWIQVTGRVSYTVSISSPAPTNTYGCSTNAFSLTPDGLPALYSWSMDDGGSPSCTGTTESGSLHGTLTDGQYAIGVGITGNEVVSDNLNPGTTSYGTDAVSVQLYFGIPDCTITGSPNAETIPGTPGDDVICAEGGNDTIDGGGGNDVILAGDGNDVVKGAGGADWVDGGFGNDTLNGGAGADKLVGGLGKDTVAGGGGNDTLYSRDKAADKVNGGTGTDKAQVDAKLDAVKAVETLLK